MFELLFDINETEYFRFTCCNFSRSRIYLRTRKKWSFTTRGTKSHFRRSQQCGCEFYFSRVVFISIRFRVIYGKNDKSISNRIATVDIQTVIVRTTKGERAVREFWRACVHNFGTFGRSSLEYIRLLSTSPRYTSLRHGTKERNTISLVRGSANTHICCYIGYRNSVRELLQTHRAYKHNVVLRARNRTFHLIRETRDIQHILMWTRATRRRTPVVYLRCVFSRAPPPPRQSSFLTSWKVSIPRRRQN